MHPDYFKYVPIPFGKANGSATIYAFYTLREYSDPETVFIRIDDDICWMAEDCVKNLVSFRLQNPEYFIVYANTVNNAICAFLHQRTGVLPYKDQIVCDNQCTGNAWSEETFTKLQHQYLLQHIDNDTVDVYKTAFDKWILLDVEKDFHWRQGDPMWNEPGRCSVNCISWLGRDFDPVRQAARSHEPSVIAEERFLAYDHPRSSGRRNCILGSALAAHYSFFSQEHFMRRTDFLERYKKISRYIRQ